MDSTVVVLAGSRSMLFSADSLRRKAQRKARRTAGPQMTNCQRRAAGRFMAQVWAKVARLGYLKRKVAMRLMVGHMSAQVQNEIA